MQAQAYGPRHCATQATRRGERNCEARCGKCDEVRKWIRSRSIGAGIDVRFSARHFGIGRLSSSCRFTFPTREPTFAKREDESTGERTSTAWPQ
jgi:hypothetical protein